MQNAENETYKTTTLDLIMSVPAEDHRDFRFTGNVTQLWDEPHAGANWTNAFSVRDLDGDDKMDVLVLTSSYNEATGTETATVIAKRGSNGKRIWTTESDGPIWVGSAWADLNGDEIADVLLGSYDQVYALGYREE